MTSAGSTDWGRDLVLSTVETSPIRDYPQKLSAFGPAIQVPAEGRFRRRLQRSHAPISVWVQWGLLFAVLPIGMALTEQLLGQTLPLLVSRSALLLAVLGMVVTYPAIGLFRRFRSLPASLFYVTIAWSLVVVEVGLAVSFLGLPSLYSTPVLVAWISVVLSGQLVATGLSHCLFTKLGTSAKCQTPVMVVGSGVLASDLVRALTTNPYLPDNIVGLAVLDDTGMVAHETRKLLGADVKYIASIEKLEIAARQLMVERVYLAVPFEQTHRIAELQQRLADLNVDVVWAPDVRAVNALNPALREISGLPLVSLSESPMNCVGSAYVKSLLDVVLATLALVVCAPVMLVTAIATKLSSPGPIIYRQQRHGWDGRVFQIWKFRSMYVQEEQGALEQAKPQDSRVTRVGRFLRRSSIDELPQLINVLRGEMSLVGPRPHAVCQNLDYAKLIGTYMARHRIKPGITGLAQISGFRGETAAVESMRDRVELDLRYINSWSIWLDLWILLKTPIALLKNKDVY